MYLIIAHDHAQTDQQGNRAQDPQQAEDPGYHAAKGRQKEPENNIVSLQRCSKTYIEHQFCAFQKICQDKFRSQYK